MTRLIIFSISIFLFSCQENKIPNQLNKETNSPQKINTDADTTIGILDTLKSLTVLSFLDKVVINKTDSITFMPIEDDGTVYTWIKPQDVDTLIALIKSKKRCKCVIDPLSSYLPTNDYGEIGGYAVLLLKQYKEKQDIRFGLYLCPKTNEKEADELIKWWAHNKR